MPGIEIENKSEVKTLHQLVKEGASLCGKMAESSFGMGMRMAAISAEPKKVAMNLLQTADQFEAVADAVRKLASDICDYDAANSTQIVVPKNGVIS